jgi:hypothetical protein
MRCAKNTLHIIVRGVEKRIWVITRRCTRLPALTAERNVKFLLSRIRAGRFIAVSATRNADLHADIKPVELS